MAELLALQMLGTIGVAIAVIVRRRNTLEHLGHRIWLACISTAILALAASIFFSIHTYRDSPTARFLMDVWDVAPVRQILVGGFLCFSLTLVSPVSHGLGHRIGAFIIAGLLAFLLGTQFRYINYNDGYLAKPEYAHRLSEHQSKLARRIVIDSLENSLKHYRTACPAGWLRESPCILSLPDEEDKKYIQYFPMLHKHLGPSTIRTTWHTWLTGLYKMEKLPWDFWYIGGQPTDLMRQIEVRIIPSQQWHQLERGSITR